MKRNFYLLLFAVTFGVAAVLVGPRGAVATESSLQDAKPTEIKIDAKLFDAFTGQYKEDELPDLVLSFWREGDKFYSRGTNQSSFEIFASSETTFFPKAFPALVTFVRDAQGTVNGLVLKQGDRELR